MQKLILTHHLSPGDVLMLTAAIRDLHENYPDQFITDVRTSCGELWENNPFITPLDENDPDVEVMKCQYELVHHSNQGSHHFIHGFVDFLNDALDLKIKPGKFKAEIYLSNDEKCWLSQIYEENKKDIPYWLVNAGTKSDYTAKGWGLHNYQAVVDALPDITFVQVGAGDHRHKDLTGKNVINLVGKTEMRQYIRLFYHAAGVLTGVSLPMHLAAAVPMKPCYFRANRPCIVMAGGREPSVWEAYTNHAYMHTCGMMDCCDDGGCWKSRAYPIGDGDDKDKDLCERTVIRGGVKIPKCMDMITPEAVVQKIDDYLSTYDYYENWDLDKDGIVRGRKENHAIF